MTVGLAAFGASQTQFPFTGNPNSSVVTIDVATTGIVASRTSGELPAFVQVSASGILATGTMANGTTLNPYEDLEFKWDFGDPTGAEIFTHPVTGLQINANIQFGPEAAYVYRTAGAKPITLTIRGCATPPVTAGQKVASVVVATATKTFTVSTFDKSGGEYFFDSVAGSDSNDGLSSGAPKQTLSALNTLLAAGHMQFWLKRGSNWLGTTGITISRSDIRIGAYGSGAQPIINMLNASTNSGVGASFNALSSENVSRAASNIVVSNVDFWRSGSTGNAIINFLNTNSTNHADDIYFDNINVVSDNTSTVHTKWIRFQYDSDAFHDATNVQRTGIWGGTITQTAGNLGGEIGYYGGARHWTFFFGISQFTGSGDSGAPNLCHHIYPNFQLHGLFRWNFFGTGPSRNFALDVNFNSQDGLYNLGGNWLIAENDFTGTLNGHDASNGRGSFTTLSDFTNFVVQQNAFHGLTQGAANFGNCISMTWRYNRVWNMPGTGTYPLVAVNAAGGATAVQIGINFKMYGNLIYQTNVGSQTSGFSPISQKVTEGAGTGVWSNGSGSAGTILNVTAIPTGAVTAAGQMLLTADSTVPGNAIVQAFGTGGTTGVGSTGTYSLTQSALVASGSVQLVLGWTKPWTITDNIVYDTSAVPVLMDLQFTNQSTATIDRNQWYAPNGGLATSAGTGTPFFNNRFAVRFGTAASSYQVAGGFGTHDIVANPNWTDPANGVF